MSNNEFWESIRAILKEGFTSQNLQKIDSYAEQFISGKLLYKRFSSCEQYGCTTGGSTHVIASILAGADVPADFSNQKEYTFKEECELGKKQELNIELWARATGCWTENINNTLSKLLGEKLTEGGEAIVYANGGALVKSIGLDYFIQPILALDRITLHNTYFPETKLRVLGFGRNEDGDFKIIVEQSFIQGSQISNDEIVSFVTSLGFELKNLRNWTYATPEIYLSDMHDENIIKSSNGSIFVIDCDIRINTPELKSGGTRLLTTEVEFV